MDDTEKLAERIADALHAAGFFPTLTSREGVIRTIAAELPRKD